MVKIYNGVVVYQNIGNVVIPDAEVDDLTVNNTATINELTVSEDLTVNDTANINKLNVSNGITTNNITSSNAYFGSWSEHDYFGKVEEGGVMINKNFSAVNLLKQGDDIHFAHRCFNDCDMNLFYGSGYSLEQTGTDNKGIQMNSSGIIIKGDTTTRNNIIIENTKKLELKGQTGDLNVFSNGDNSVISSTNNEMYFFKGDLDNYGASGVKGIKISSSGIEIKGKVNFVNGASGISPSNNTDLTTKAYVDSVITTGYNKNYSTTNLKSLTTLTGNTTDLSRPFVIYPKVRYNNWLAYIVLNGYIWRLNRNWNSDKSNGVYVSRDGGTDFCYRFNCVDYLTFGNIEEYIVFTYYNSSSNNSKYLAFLNINDFTKSYGISFNDTKILTLKVKNNTVYFTLLGDNKVYFKKLTKWTDITSLSSLSDFYYATLNNTLTDNISVLEVIEFYCNKYICSVNGNILEVVDDNVNTNTLKNTQYYSNVPDELIIIDNILYYRIEKTVYMYSLLSYDTAYQNKQVRRFTNATYEYFTLNNLNGSLCFCYDDKTAGSTSNICSVYCSGLNYYPTLTLTYDTSTINKQTYYFLLPDNNLMIIELIYNDNSTYNYKYAVFRGDFNYMNKDGKISDSGNFNKYSQNVNVSGMYDSQLVNVKYLKFIVEEICNTNNLTNPLDEM